VIHKVPTAWIPLRDSHGRVVNAKVEEKAAVDFLGVYRGRPLAFDAKHCSGDRIRWDRVEDHQAQFLEDWTRNGGIGFVLVGFGMRRFFVVPWVVWRESLLAWKRKEEQASITAERLLQRWEIPVGGSVALDYLFVVDKLWF
jgi:recombination protein U